jgi:hypothetical protein
VEDDVIAVAARGELDLAGLEVADEGGEAKRGRLDVDHAHRAVPRPWHAHDELVPEGHAPLVAEDLLEARELGGRHAVRSAAHERHELLGRALRVADAHAVATVEERAGAVLRQLHLLVRDAGRQPRRGVLGR